MNAPGPFLPSRHPVTRATARKAASVITGRCYLERGHPVTVLARWSGKGPRNVLIERADGSKTVRPFRGLRRAVITPVAAP